MTGGPAPKLEDVIAMVLEDVSVIGGLFSTSSTASSRRRSLRAASAHPLQTRRRALRAHHLPYNRFIRPRRMSTEQRRLADEDTSSDLIDDISVTGGYDGKMIFVRYVEEFFPSLLEYTFCN